MNCAKCNTPLATGETVCRKCNASAAGGGGTQIVITNPNSVAVRKFAIIGILAVAAVVIVVVILSLGGSGLEGTSWVVRDDWGDGVRISFYEDGQGRIFTSGADAPNIWHNWDSFRWSEVDSTVDIASAIGNINVSGRTMTISWLDVPPRTFFRAGNVLVGGGRLAPQEFFSMGTRHNNMERGTFVTTLTRE